MNMHMCHFLTPDTAPETAYSDSNLISRGLDLSHVILKYAHEGACAITTEA